MPPKALTFGFLWDRSPWGARAGVNAWTCVCQPSHCKHGRTEKTCKKCGQQRPNGMEGRA